MKNQRCKGMQDLLPGDMSRFRRIEDVFRTCCRHWGYQEVRTPTLEYLYLFTATGTLTPSMLSRVYSFLDWDGWSGERVVLRPDGTIPVARLYIEHLSGQQSARLFYVTNILSFEGTGKQNRERWQCGAEFFGGAKFAPDVEIILLAEEVLRRLGIRNTKLQLSHAGLVQALLKALKLSPGEAAKVTDRILEGDWHDLTKAKATDSEGERLLAALLGLKGKSSSFLRNVKASFPRAPADFKSSLEDFLSVTTLLDNLDCGYEIDIAAIHGFEYYTGVCFQLMANGEKVAGGGRYDKLVPLMNGEEVPACGFALYVDTMMRLLPPEKAESGKSGILVKGEGLSSESVRACFSLAGSLRDAGYTAVLTFRGEEAGDCRWVVSVSGEGPCAFLVEDCLQQRQQMVASVAEVLEVVGKQ